MKRSVLAKFTFLAFLVLGGAQAFAATIQGWAMLSDNSDSSGVTVVMYGSTSVPSLTFWGGLILAAIFSGALATTLRGRLRYVAPAVVLVFSSLTAAYAYSGYWNVATTDSAGFYQFMDVPHLDPNLNATYTFQYMKPSYSESRRYNVDLKYNAGIVQFDKFEVELIRIPDTLVANDPLAGYQCCGDVGVAEDGNFVVAWQGEQVLRTFTFDVFARRFNAEGVPLGPQFQVNTYSTGTQGTAAVDMNDDGRFVVVWESTNQAGGTTPLRDVYAQIYDETGTAVGPEIHVNQSTVGEQKNAAVGVGPDGNFVVAWEDFDSNVAYADIRARRFGKTGTALGDEFLANSGTFKTGLQLSPKVSMGFQGRFVIVWRSTVKVILAERDFDIVGNVYTADGASATLDGFPFYVNSITAGEQANPDVVMGLVGRFQVVWSHKGVGDPFSKDIYARDFFNSGAPQQTTEFKVSRSPYEEKSSPKVVVDSSDNYLYIWQTQNLPDVNLQWRYFFARYRDFAVGFKQFETNMTPDADTDVFSANIDMAPSGKSVFAYDDINANFSLDGDVRVTRDVPRY